MIIASKMNVQLDIVLSLHQLTHATTYAYVVREELEPSMLIKFTRLSSAALSSSYLSCYGDAIYLGTDVRIR